MRDSSKFYNIFLIVMQYFNVSHFGILGAHGLSPKWMFHNYKNSIFSENVESHFMSNIKVKDRDTNQTLIAVNYCWQKTTDIWWRTTNDFLKKADGDFWWLTSIWRRKTTD